ncbi:AAA family ATPase [Pseudarthrobacter sp. J64]|uniref:AAA family ATPase n=1 Tax=Pseudarthrobacter sp. J64 TaxID=3116485 RepID=UPI002E821A67|nr:AAA family ATPase [Pseudarthrobacter sp. J64]MEE2571017.1 AAA family ATPase [Pseudarthrobacter sp. J64]
MPTTEPDNSKPISVLFEPGDDGRRFLSGHFDEFREAPPPHADTRPAFVTTREHRRFKEFADTVRSHRYIGLCYGPPGIGKTLSARHYAGTDEWEQWHPLSRSGGALPPVPEAVQQSRTAFFTPTVAATIKQIDQGLPRACQHISWAIDYAQHGHVDPYVHAESQHSGNTELLIIDEADRLKTAGLEQVRDFYDRHRMGVILIGMPGIEKRLARYPQLYSRIGFAHEYRPLRSDELTAVVAQRLPDPNPDDSGLAHTAALAAIVRATNGNFRLADRLVTQVNRILTINKGNAEPLVDSFPYPARQAGSFMMVSNSMGVNFPSRRCRLRRW